MCDEYSRKRNPLTILSGNVPGENPRKHEENMQTPRRKMGLIVELNSGPACCEATMLTTVLPFFPFTSIVILHV